MSRYSPERKEAVLSKLLPPYNLTVAELARQEPALFMSPKKYSPTLLSRCSSAHSPAQA